MNLNATLFGEMLTFIIFVLITMKFIWPPLVKAMSERQKKIVDGLEAAKRGERSLILAQQKATKILLNAKNEAESIINQAYEHASKIIDDAKVTGRIKGKRLVDSARIEINKQIEAARENLISEFTDLTIMGARKILDKEIDKSANEKMVEELIKEMKYNDKV